MSDINQCTCDDLVNNGDHYCPIHGTFAPPSVSVKTSAAECGKPLGSSGYLEVYCKLKAGHKPPCSPTIEALSGEGGERQCPTCQTPLVRQEIKLPATYYQFQEAQYVVAARGLADPFMVAWNKFVVTAEYSNALKWALANTYDDGREISAENRKNHAEGAMWLAFTKGMEISE